MCVGPQDWSSERVPGLRIGVLRGVRGSGTSGLEF